MNYLKRSCHPAVLAVSLDSVALFRRLRRRLLESGFISELPADWSVCFDFLISDSGSEAYPADGVEGRDRAVVESGRYKTSPGGVKDRTRVLEGRDEGFVSTWKKDEYK